MADTPQQAAIRAQLAKRASQVSYQVPAAGQQQASSQYTAPGMGRGSVIQPGQPSKLSRAKTAVSGRLAKEPTIVTSPFGNGLPRAFSNRQFITAAWAISMIIVSYDEIKTYHVAPRPKRLFDTSMVYLGLMLVSVAGALVPIANLLAAGFTLAVAWDLFNASGQFARDGSPGISNVFGNKPLINTDQPFLANPGAAVDPNQTLAPGVTSSPPVLTRPGFLPTESRL